MAGVSEGASAGWRARLRAEVQARYYDLQLFRVKRRRTRLAPPAGGGLVIVPPDIRDPIGSRGDEAMIQAILDAVRERDHHIPITILSDGGDVPVRITGSDVTVVRDWPEPWNLAAALDLIDGDSRLAIVGADVMDGYYSSATSLRRWQLADAFASRPGCRATIVGCSFNAAVPAPVRRFLARPMAERVAINLRDPASFRRFSAVAASPARQVADCAFLLRPEGGAEAQPALAWIAAQRAAGRQVCGLNIHPMLSPTRDPAEIDALVTEAAAAARAVIDESDAAILLLPHDFREDRHGDVALLNRLAGAIDRPDRALCVAEPLAANQIKRVAAALDFVFTGRMHLAIAALGSGVPVLGITYTDKFDGLFELAGLPRDQLITAAAAGRPGALTAAFRTALAAAPALRTTLAANLDRVTALARGNLESLF